MQAPEGPPALHLSLGLSSTCGDLAAGLHQPACPKTIPGDSVQDRTGGGWREVLGLD